MRVARITNIPHTLSRNGIPNGVLNQNGETHRPTEQTVSLWRLIQLEDSLEFAETPEELSELREEISKLERTVDGVEYPETAPDSED